MQITDDNTIHPLFPISLFREVPQMIEKVYNSPLRSLRESVDTAGG